MQQQETSAWGGMTPAEAAEAFPMPSIADCIEQDRQIIAEEDGPLDLDNISAEACEEIRNLTVKTVNSFAEHFKIGGEMPSLLAEGLMTQIAMHVRRAVWSSHNLGAAKGRDDN